MFDFFGSPSKGFSSDNVRFAGDINVEKVTITSLANGKTFNVTNQLLTIQVFEDLFAPFMSGSLIFKESFDFVANFPFIGEEVLDLRIFTPGFDKNDKKNIINARFYIYKISDREKMGDRSIVYQLHFISVEAITELNTKISKGFEGKIAEIVANLIGTWLQGPGQKDKKGMNISLTANETKYVSNYWSPIKNINYLADRALDTNSNPTYIFFENRYGFNFTSLDKLNSKSVKQVFINNQTQDEVKPGGGSVRNITKQYQGIKDIEIITNQNYMDRVMGGAYGSTIMYFDITKKKFVKITNTPSASFPGGETHLNEKALFTSKLIATNKGVMFNDVVHSKMFDDFDDVTSVTMRLKRVSRLKMAEAFKINIVVPGRTDYTVGDKVEIKSYKVQPIQKSDSEEDILDHTISGNYLVASINHVIDRKHHECHMQLIKDSYKRNLKI